MIKNAAPKLDELHVCTDTLEFALEYSSSMRRVRIYSSPTESFLSRSFLIITSYPNGKQEVTAFPFILSEKDAPSLSQYDLLPMITRAALEAGTLYDGKISEASFSDAAQENWIATSLQYITDLCQTSKLKKVALIAHDERLEAGCFGDKFIDTIWCDPVRLSWGMIVNYKQVKYKMTYSEKVDDKTPETHSNLCVNPSDYEVIASIAPTDALVTNLQNELKKTPTPQAVG